MRLWPLAFSAALFWAGWVLSTQMPWAWHPTDQLYASVQRGCVAAWYWSPAERPSLGIHDHITFSASRSSSLANLPFAWCDPWGYGIGTPLWLPALILTALAARRYAVTAVRGAPAVAQRARWWAVVWVSVWGVFVCGLLISAGHREENVWSLGAKRLRLENGAFVVDRPEDSAPSGLAGRVVTGGTITSGGRLAGLTITNGVVTAPAPPRQSSLPIDLLPDLNVTATTWRFALPLWPLVIGLAWLAWKARSKAAFRGAGLCAACGYNLGGLPPGSCCPECGHAASSAEAEPRLE